MDQTCLRMGGDFGCSTCIVLNITCIDLYANNTSAAIDIILSYLQLTFLSRHHTLLQRLYIRCRSVATSFNHISIQAKNKYLPLVLCDVRVCRVVRGNMDIIRCSRLCANISKQHTLRHPHCEIGRTNSCIFVGLEFYHYVCIVP